MRNKKFILVCAILSLSLVGCGSKNNSSVGVTTEAQIDNNSSYHGVSNLTKDSIEEEKRNDSKTNIVVSDDESVNLGNDFSSFTAEDAINYKLDNFGGNILISDDDTKVSNMLYYRDHNVKQNLLNEPLYSYKDFVDYSLWLDNKLGTDSEFQQSYSELSESDDLIESSLSIDMSFKLDDWEWKVAEVENVDNDIRLHITFTKAPDFNFSNFNNSNKLLGVLNTIISDYSDLKITSISKGTSTDDNFSLFLGNQIFTIANLHGTISEDGSSSEVTIRLYSANAE